MVVQKQIERGDISVMDEVGPDGSVAHASSLHVAVTCGSA